MRTINHHHRMASLHQLRQRILQMEAGGRGRQAKLRQAFNAQLHHARERKNSLRGGGSPPNMNKSTARICIAALLSSLVYKHSPAVFDTYTLIQLGLVMRYTYSTHPTATKCIVLQKVAEGSTQLETMKLYRRSMGAEQVRESAPRIDKSQGEEGWDTTEDFHKHLYLKRAAHQLHHYNKVSDMFCGNLFSEKVDEYVDALGLAQHLEIGDVFVIFRGTQKEKAANLGLDLGQMQDLAPEKGGGKVNTLFYKAYQDIEERIKTGLDKCTDIQNVVFSGHSRGAALALLAAQYLLIDSIPNEQRHYIGFGVPDFMDPTAVKKLSDFSKIFITDPQDNVINLMTVILTQHGHQLCRFAHTNPTPPWIKWQTGNDRHDIDPHYVPSVFNSLQLARYEKAGKKTQIVQVESKYTDPTGTEYTVRYLNQPEQVIHTTEECVTPLVLTADHVKKDPTEALEGAEAILAFCRGATRGGA